MNADMAHSIDGHSRIRPTGKLNLRQGPREGRLEPGSFRAGVQLKNIYVGNLSSNLTPDEIRLLFETFGAVQRVEIMTDPGTGYSRGFAFVEMTEDIAASKAVLTLNGTTVWDHPLRVEEAGPKFRST
jgi:RNA recognition motif-containing protein